MAPLWARCSSTRSAPRTRQVSASSQTERRGGCARSRQRLPRTVFFCSQWKDLNCSDPPSQAAEPSPPRIPPTTRMSPPTQLRRYPPQRARCARHRRDRLGQALPQEQQPRPLSFSFCLCSASSCEYGRRGAVRAQHAAPAATHNAAAVPLRAPYSEVQRVRERGDQSRTQAGEQRPRFQRREVRFVGDRSNKGDGRAQARGDAQDQHEQRGACGHTHNITLE